jgi:hypothetical protein
MGSVGVLQFVRFSTTASVLPSSPPSVTSISTIPTGSGFAEPLFHYSLKQLYHGIHDAFAFASLPHHGETGVSGVWTL